MKTSIHLLTLLVIFTFAVCVANSQTTEFTYQGSLSIGNPPVPTSVNHDFEFRLFSVETGGSAISTLQRLNVAITNGSFTVKLDFGTQFPGASRYLEIAARSAGGGSFQTLSPRHLISNAPYAVRSLNAANADNATNASSATNALQLGGVAANQFVLTTDSRMTDARNPLPNSTNYIQNQNSGTQASSNF